MEGIKIDIAAIIAELLKVVPSWVFLGIGIIILIMLLGICFLVWMTLHGTYKNSQRGHIEKDLKDEIVRITKSKDIYQEQVARLEHIIKNARSFTSSYVNLVNEEKDNFDENIQRIIESICNDIKMTARNGHRSGFWFFEPDQNNPSNGVLSLMFGSSGFPDNYFGNRKLDIHNSIAGRSFRKGTVQLINEVSKDPDWDSNGSNNYKAILCVPIRDYGVVTVDSNEDITEQIKIIVELYSVIIEGVFDSMQRNLTQQP